MPTELVDSRNRKKMETARSETTLTDLRGCRDLTFDATSCTQMERDIRWAILNNRLANSSKPDGWTGAPLPSLPPFPSLPLDSDALLPPRYFLHSLRMATNVDGTAASSTESASTMAISSSSERCASLAASSSSFAMPNDTENARSDPSEPRAPAVAIESDRSQGHTGQPPACTMQFTLSSAEVRSASREACVLGPVIACQQGLSLCVRRLLISPMADSKTPGRGGKAVRQRVGNTHFHSCAGNVYGCLLSQVLQFVKRPTEHVSEAVRTLRSCLQPVGKDLMMCNGADVKHLVHGFASSYAIRGQLSYLSDSKEGARIDSRYGKKSVVVGLSACVYFVLYALSHRADNSASILLACDGWMQDSCRSLSHWKGCVESMGMSQSPELMAERRALERGRSGLVHAKRHAKWLGLNTYDSVRMCIAYMRKAMWPAGKHLDEASHADLLRWIDSDGFRDDLDVPRVERPALNFTFNVPLSAIPTLGGARGDGESVCDSASSSGSNSSYWSASSAASDAGMDASVAELSTLFASGSGPL